MSVDLSGIAACQARITELQARFGGGAGPVQPGTYTADGALNGKTAWNYKLQDLVNVRSYDNTTKPWSGVDPMMSYGNISTPNGMGGTFTVMILDDKPDEKAVTVRVCYGRITETGHWHRWLDWDGYIFTTTRDQLSKPRRLGDRSRRAA